MNSNINHDHDHDHDHDLGHQYQDQDEDQDEDEDEDHQDHQAGARRCRQVTLSLFQPVGVRVSVLALGYGRKELQLHWVDRATLPKEAIFA